jgi:hypothetical protein
VRRALIRALYEDHGFEQATDGSTRTIDVDVLAFEELRRGPHHGGRVELRYDVRDDQRVIARGTVTVERDAAPNIEAVVVAIGGALDDAAAQVASRVAGELAAR